MKKVKMRKTQNRMENKRKHLRVKCSDGMRLEGHKGGSIEAKDEQKNKGFIKWSSSGSLNGK